MVDTMTSNKPLRVLILTYIYTDGDPRYGGNQILKGTLYSKYKQFVETLFTILPRQALHARVLGFTHPRTGEKVYFESDLPQDMQTVINKWREYVQSRKALI